MRTLDVMPFRPSYAIWPGDRIDVEVVQPDGGHALVVAKLDTVSESAGGRALRIRVCSTHVCPLPRPHRASSAAAATDAGHP
jgi:hypothetical protein